VNGYCSRVELLRSNGEHLRWIPGGQAKELVDSGAAWVVDRNGRVRAIQLVVRASTHCTLIGPPTVPTGLPGVRFVFQEPLEGSAARVWAFHKRSLEPPD
jgi:hypothetical protein